MWVGAFSCNSSHELNVVTTSRLKTEQQVVLFLDNNLVVLSFGVKNRYYGQINKKTIDKM